MYEDASRRRADHQKARDDYEKIRDKPKQEKYYNTNSDKYVIQRISREMKNAIKAINDLEDEQDRLKENSKSVTQSKVDPKAK